MTYRSAVCEDAPSLGNFIAEIRESRRLSPTALARAAGVARSSVYNWELGRSLPRVQELEAVLRTLDASATQTQNALMLLGAPRAGRRLREMEDTPEILPHGGDLLRAMRLRRNWTQVQAAEVLGVTQPTVARWERAEAWPGPEQLHQVCCRYGARPEEFAAVAQGALTLSRESLGAGGSTDIDLLAARLAEIEHRLKDPEYYGLGDLFYLSLEAQAASLTRENADARILMARILLSHAAFVGWRCQPAEAGRLGEQALSFIPRRGEQWNDLRLSVDMYWTVWKYPMREHSVVLRPWLDRTLTARSMNWVMSQIIASFTEQGQMDNAMALEEEATALVLRSSSPELMLKRQNARAELLLNIGRASEAADLLTITEAMQPSARLRTKITLTEANLAAGNRSCAHDWLQEVHVDHNALRIAHYQPQIDELTAQL